jgi:hypothetical protein
MSSAVLAETLAATPAHLVVRQRVSIKSGTVTHQGCILAIRKSALPRVIRSVFGLLLK